MCGYKSLIILVLLGYNGSLQAATAAAALHAEAPITLPSKPASFDFMNLDAGSSRLLAAHKGAGTLTVFDLKSGHLVSEIPVGTVQGVAVNASNGTYILGDDDEAKVVVVDAKTLAVLADIKVPGAVDAVAVDEKNGLIYADRDHGSTLWVLDPKTKSVVATLSLPGNPEYIAYDPVSDRLYQNIKTANVVVVIDPNRNKIESTWSTLPATSPHGLAVDGKSGRLFIAGQNGKLVSLDMKTGKQLGVAPIALKVDQVAMDVGRQIVYAGCKGFISAVKVNKTSMQALGDTPSPTGAKTLAVDPQTHAVWVSYADKAHSYLQKFGAAP